MDKKQWKFPQLKNFSLSKINKWKTGFFILLAVVLGSMVFFVSRITATREIIQREIPALVEREGSPVLNIRSNKEQINALIGFYLDEYMKDSEVKFDFILQNEALLTGEFKVLGFPITFYLYFEPYVMDNGNIQLKAKSLSLGTLNVPIREVMKMIKNSQALPEWVEINPTEENVMIRLDQFRMQNGLFIKADKINLVEDEIQVSLFLPETDEE